MIGVYSTNNNEVLMVFTAGFALFGYILLRFGLRAGADDARASSSAR